MTTRGKWLLAGAGLLAVAWSCAQLFLTHRLAVAFYDKSVSGCARLAAEHPGGTCYPLRPVAASDWLPYAATSIVLLAALTTTAALLVRGGRRWWALLAAAMPAANLLWGWQDWRPLGAGWMQLSGANLTTWTVAGIVTDTATVAVIALALILALPSSGRAEKLRPDLARTVPPVLVLAGWWLMRHPLPGIVDKIWLVQGAAFVLAAGLLARCALPLWLRAVGVLVVLPLTSLPISTEAMGFGSRSIVLHAAAFAAGTAAFVLGLPALRRQLQLRKRDGSASSAPTSAMT